MNKRWAHSQQPGFTVVELIIVIFVIAVLVSLSIIAYNGVQRSSAERAVQSDLHMATSEMERALQRNGATYPTTLPSSVTSSPNIALTLKQSGTMNRYNNLTAVQNGMLLAQICQDLVDEGVGKGADKGGVTKAYITGCGNWNHNSMQFTGWDSKVFATPVTDTALTNYATNFTTNDAYNKAQESVIKTFYGQLVDRLVRQGGSFPVTSFWDYWATSSNGGVLPQPLGTPVALPYYCIEATSTRYPDVIWHVTEDLKLAKNSC